MYREYLALAYLVDLCSLGTAGLISANLVLAIFTPMLHIFAFLDAKWNVLESKEAQGAKEKAHRQAHHPRGHSVYQLSFSKAIVIAIFALGLESVGRVRISIQHVYYS